MRFGDAARSAGRVASARVFQAILPLLLAFLMGAMGPQSSAEAQPFRADDTFYIKFGAGLSDYAGDASGPNFGNNTGQDVPLLDPTVDFEDLFDTQKFTDGDVFPYAITAEGGYHFMPALSVGIGYQFGQYPFVSGLPFTRPGNPVGVDKGDLGTIRHTVQLMGRYTIKAADWRVAPYFDVGVNASFGGNTPSVGPTVGGGIDVSISGRNSLFLEARFNFTRPDDAIDGVESGDNSFDALSALPVLGIKHTFSRPAVPPRIIALNGPAEVQVGESADFTARINEDATQPLTYRWNFGDGRTASGLEASHVYNQPGTYTVMFSARNNAGMARDSLSVEVLHPARILSISADPNPAKEGELVRFESEVDGASPLSFEWDFGDGNTGFGASPTHTYEEPGEYTVRLVASNEDGQDTDSLTMRVERVRPAICETVREFNSVYFDFGSSQITSAAEKELQENVDVLLKCPNLTVRVEGFASSDEPKGQALSEARAQAVTDFYVDEGVDSGRIQTSGEGVVEGAAGKKGKGDAQQARRVDTILLNDDTGASQQNN